MIKLKLGDLKYTPEQLKESRQKSLEAIQRWKEADEALEKLCKELGIEKPIITC